MKITESTTVVMMSVVTINLSSEGLSLESMILPLCVGKKIPTIPKPNRVLKCIVGKKVLG